MGPPKRNSRFLTQVSPTLWIQLLSLLVSLSLGCYRPLQPELSPPEPFSSTERVAEEEAISLDRLNATRSKHGFSPVRRHSALDKVARDHSRNMRNQGFFDHRDPSGRQLSERLQEAHIPFQWAAENLSWIDQTDQPAKDSLGYFLESPAHRTHLLNPSYSWVGIGFAQQGDSFWITHVYLSPNSSW